MYMDGSESSNGVGCAEDTTYIFKLPDYVSICTAELAAVAFALDHSSDSNFVIYTDSSINP